MSLYAETAIHKYKHKVSLTFSVSHISLDTYLQREQLTPCTIRVSDFELSAFQGSRREEKTKNIQER